MDMMACIGDRERFDAASFRKVGDLPAFQSLLVCPACRARLRASAQGFRCFPCGEDYASDAAGQIDLRLRTAKSYSMDYVPSSVRPLAVPLVEHLPAKTAANGVDRTAELPTALSYGNRFIAPMLDHLPRAVDDGEWMLDLGCGDRRFEAICTETTGLNYVGMDAEGREPHVLGDAHAVPFCDESFRLIISVAVLEHLAVPDLAMMEAFRVLKPGGMLIGTVAFLEPFHMDSHFHMTHLGTARILERAGFDIVAIAPNAEWTGLRAQAEMALYGGLPAAVQRALVALPLTAATAYAAAKRLVGRGQADPLLTRASTTGGFRFIARRGGAV